MIEAMTHELTGKHLFSTGDEALAAVSFKKALTSYEEWGAVAKLKKLEDEIRETFAGGSISFQDLIERK
jgi:hypothetical protein